jgi:DNA-binding winged helix-turn-helix (wHTH) protein/Tfp pilus assembly protein PilF
VKTYRFDRFEIDAPAGELRRDGARIALAPKVAELLVALLESGGSVVSRTELQDRLWPDTHTDRERGLNNAMNRLREALADSAADPRFIETVPKRGYRFLARVDLVEPVRPRPARRSIAIAACVAAGLLAVAVLVWVRQPRPSDPPAPAEYWAALRRLKLGGVTDLAEARSLLETAAGKSPSFAPAYAALAGVLLDLIDGGKVEPAGTRRLAAEAARTAVRLRNDSADAHLAMGSVRLRAEWQLRLAGEEIDRALRLNPALAEAWRARATLFLARGDAGRAVQAAERGVALDPLSAWVGTASGRAIFYQRDVNRSLDRLEQTLRIAPEFGPAHRYLSEVYWQIGRPEDARREFMKTLRYAGADPADVERAELITSQDGLPGYWRSQLPSLQAQQNRYGVPFKLGAIYAALDQPDQALSALERSLQQNDMQLLFLRVNPWFDRLRSNPRFQALLQRIPSS